MSKYICNITNCLYAKSCIMIFLCLFFCSEYIVAQNWLKKAEDTYENGQIEKVTPLVNGNLKKENTKDNVLKAKRLQILSHLYNNEYTKADSGMLDLLTFENEYVLLPEDSLTEFEYLYNSYRTDPVFSLGGFGGTNITNIRFIDLYGVYNTNNAQQSVGSIIGYHMGLQYNLYLDRLLKNFQLDIELYYKQLSYQYTNQLYSYTKLSMVETQSSFQVPVSIVYARKKQIFNSKSKFLANTIPYIRVGASFNYALTNEVKPTRIYTDDSHNDVKGTDIDISDLRKNMNISIMAGLGLKYKIRMNYICFDVRYDFGLFNSVNTKNRYSNPELLYNYFYIDNNFKTDNLSFSLGFVRLFYYPKKKTDVNKFFFF